MFVPTYVFGNGILLSIIINHYSFGANVIRFIVELLTVRGLSVTYIESQLNSNFTQQTPEMSNFISDILEVLQDNYNHNDTCPLSVMAAARRLPLRVGFVWYAHVVLIEYEILYVI